MCSDHVCLCLCDGTSLLHIRLGNKIVFVVVFDFSTSTSSFDTAPLTLLSCLGAHNNINGEVSQAGECKLLSK